MGFSKSLLCRMSSNWKSLATLSRSQENQNLGTPATSTLLSLPITSSFPKVLGAATKSRFVTSVDRLPRVLGRQDLLTILPPHQHDRAKTIAKHEGTASSKMFDALKPPTQQDPYSPETRHMMLGLVNSRTNLFTIAGQQGPHERFAINVLPFPVDDASSQELLDGVRAYTGASNVGLPGIQDFLGFTRWVSKFGPVPIPVYDGTQEFLSASEVDGPLNLWDGGKELHRGAVVLVGFRILVPSSLAARQFFTFVPETVTVLYEATDYWKLDEIADL